MLSAQVERQLKSAAVREKLRMGMDALLDGKISSLSDDLLDLFSFPKSVTSSTASPCNRVSSMREGATLNRVAPSLAWWRWLTPARLPPSRWPR